LNPGGFFCFMTMEYFKSWCVFAVIITIFTILGYVVKDLWKFDVMFIAGYSARFVIEWIKTK